MKRADLKFLKEEFQTAMNEVVGNDFYTSILKRKFTHSKRVLENGINIINHDIPELLKQPRLVQQCEQALFFHDIGRFEETVNLYKDELINTLKHYDHGILGAEILAKNENYNDIKIILAIRHHGHLIEEFYSDKDFQKLPSALQTEAETMIKIVRDADKLDLFYLQKYYDNIEKDYTFTKFIDKQKFGHLTPKVLEQFFSHQPINNRLMKTFSDRILECISAAQFVSHKEVIIFAKLLSSSTNIALLPYCAIFSTIFGLSSIHKKSQALTPKCFSNCATNSSDSLG